MNAAEKLSKARTMLILDHPFFGALALRMKLIDNDEIKTLAVDGKNIYYNAEFIDTLSTKLAMSAIAHEVMHCVFQHLTRRGTRDPKKWNCAGDYIINDTLEQAGFEIGESWLLDPQYRGMTTDHVYSLMPETPPDPQDELIEENTDETVMAEQERDWKIATAQAAQAAKINGKLSKNLEQFIENLLKPQVNWKEVLRRFITQASNHDYTWARPNRRYLPWDLYLPSQHSEAMGEIVVAIDTSGSINQQTLDTFAAELKAIKQDTQPEKVTVIYCDACINHVDTFDKDQDLELHPHGGGGTDFRPPIAYVQEHDIQPVCMLYLTDGYGPFPAEPQYPFLWVMTTEVVAPFGENLKIEI